MERGYFFAFFEFITWHCGKDLATVDELAVLDGGKCILQLRGVRPFMSNKYDITKHPNYKYLSDASDKNYFDIEKYLSTHLKTKPEDVYEVFEVDASDEVATAWTGSFQINQDSQDKMATFKNHSK